MPDVNVSKSSGSSDGGVRLGIRLRNEQFTLRCNVLNIRTEDARAEFIGMNYRALWSARKGNGVGDKFIASTLEAFGRHADQFARMNLPITFEALFETAMVPAPSADEAKKADALAAASTP